MADEKNLEVPTSPVPVPPELPPVDPKPSQQSVQPAVTSMGGNLAAGLHPTPPSAAPAGVDGGASSTDHPHHPHSHGHKRTPRWLFALLVVVVIGGGIAIIIHSSRTLAPPAVVGKPAQAKVTITSTGFSPAVLSIVVGAEVTWTNTDTKSHQVAADPYPLDNSIPNFDSTRVLLPGDSYSFTFETTGNYHYHDELNPLKELGEVIVK